MSSFNASRCGLWTWTVLQIRHKQLIENETFNRNCRNNISIQCLIFFFGASYVFTIKGKWWKPPTWQTLLYTSNYIGSLHYLKTIDMGAKTKLKWSSIQLFIYFKCTNSIFLWCLWITETYILTDSERQLTCTCLSYHRLLPFSWKDFHV